MIYYVAIIVQFYHLIVFYSTIKCNIIYIMLTGYNVVLASDRQGADALFQVYRFSWY